VLTGRRDYLSYTGKPKSIKDNVGDTLPQHLNERILLGNIHNGDRAFCFSTCSWMVWIWLKFSHTEPCKIVKLAVLEIVLNPR